MFSQAAPLSDPAEKLASSSGAGTESNAATVAVESAEATEGTQSQAGEERVFEINVSKSIHDHERYIREQPMFGPWKPASYKSSFMSMSLRELLPRSLMSSGLADWATASQKYRKEDIEEQMNVAGARSQYPFSMAFREQEKHRKTVAKELPKVMESLSEFSKSAPTGHLVNTDEGGS